MRAFSHFRYGWFSISQIVHNACFLAMQVELDAEWRSHTARLLVQTRVRAAHTRARMSREAARQSARMSWGASTAVGQASHIADFENRTSCTPRKTPKSAAGGGFHATHPKKAYRRGVTFSQKVLSRARGMPLFACFQAPLIDASCEVTRPIGIMKAECSICIAFVRSGGVFARRVARAPRASGVRARKPQGWCVGANASAQRPARTKRTARATDGAHKTGVRAAQRART